MMDVTKLSIEIEFKFCYFLFYGVLRVRQQDLRFNLNKFKMLLLLLMSLSGCVFLVALISIKRSKDRRAPLTLLDNYELFLASKICSSFSIIQHAAHRNTTYTSDKQVEIAIF